MIRGEPYLVTAASRLRVVLSSANSAKPTARGATFSQWGWPWPAPLATGMLRSYRRKALLRKEQNVCIFSRKHLLRLMQSHENRKNKENKLRPV